MVFQPEPLRIFHFIVDYTHMRIAVISDIHSNMEAFTMVLVDANASCVDEIICLGEVIGYGPEPNEAIRLIRERNIPTVMGNHELGVAECDYMDHLNPIAWTADLGR